MIRGEILIFYNPSWMFDQTPTNNGAFSEVTFQNIIREKDSDYQWISQNLFPVLKGWLGSNNTLLQFLLNFAPLGACFSFSASLLYPRFLLLYLVNIIAPKRPIWPIHFADFVRTISFSMIQNGEGLGATQRPDLFITQKVVKHFYIDTFLCCPKDTKQKWRHFLELHLK